MTSVCVFIVIAIYETSQTCFAFKATRHFYLFINFFYQDSFINKM